MTRERRADASARRHLDEEPPDVDDAADEVERCWGYAIPVRRATRRVRREERS